MTADELLKQTLIDIVAADTDYKARYGLVLQAMHLAHMAGLPAAVRIDPKEPEWPVAFIELPTGQVSWHLQQHNKEWDGHTTEEKFARIARYADPESMYVQSQTPRRGPTEGCCS